MQPLSRTRTSNRRRPKTSKQERVCSICSKAFSKAEHLARHYRSHTKEKPFQCSQCGRVYTRQDTLLRHARSHCPLNEAEQSSGGRQGHHDPQITVPLHMMRMEGTDVAMERSVSPSSSSSMHDITATRKSPMVLSDRVDTTIVPVEGIEGGGTYVSPILTSTSPLSQNLGADFPVDGGLDPLAISNIELESGWSSWLMGSDFDLDALNSSLLEATTGDDLFIDKIAAEARPAVGSFSNGPQAADVRPTPGCEAIRRKWHTYCERTLSDTITSDSSIDGTQIDESYRNELADRLQPRVQPGILPSTAFLHLCLQAYFTHFHPSFPLIHEASFRPSKRNAVLLLSICSVGSLFLGSRRAIDHGISMFERLQKAVLSSWDAMLAQRPHFSTAAIQSALLGQTFGLLVGRPKDLAGIEAFHGSIIAMMRRARLFSLRAPQEIDIRDLAEDALQSAWMTWVSMEEKKRIVLGIFIHDAELAKLNHHEPSLRPALERLPVPSSNEIFAAPNAIIWKNLVLQGKHDAAARSAPRSGSVLAQDRIPEGMSDFGLCSMLESISALACECSIPYSLALNTTTQKCQEMLMRWYETHSSVLTLRKSWTAPLMALWHSIFILIYANLDTLERACGRDGPEAVQEAIPYAREWANSHEARRCLFHAVWIRRHFESMSIGCEFPLHMPTCLYHCGIVWFCFGQFGAHGKPPAVVAQDQVAFPELSLLVVDGNRIVADEIKNSHGGWNASNQVFRIVGLLQRIPHWKLSSHLASTLLALVEEQDTIF